MLGNNFLMEQLFLLILVQISPFKRFYESVYRGISKFKINRLKDISSLLFYRKKLFGG